MMLNHKQFIKAIHAKKKVCGRCYSKADSGLLELDVTPPQWSIPRNWGSPV